MPRNPRSTAPRRTLPTPSLVLPEGGAGFSVNFFHRGFFPSAKKFEIFEVSISFLNIFTFIAHKQTSICLEYKGINTIFFLQPIILYYVMFATTSHNEFCCVQSINARGLKNETFSHHNVAQWLQPQWSQHVECFAASMV